MERPKFCVGELVGIESVMRPDLNCIETEILKSKYQDGTQYLGTNYTGFTYRVDANNQLWRETGLRKTPKRKDQSFKALMDRLTEPTRPKKVEAPIESLT